MTWFKLWFMKQLVYLAEMTFMIRITSKVFQTTARYIKKSLCSIFGIWKVSRQYVFWHVHSKTTISRAREPEPVGARCFWLLGAEVRPSWKKTGFGAAWKKKSGAGAGAAKKLSGSSALLEDKKHKENVLLLLFFR